MKVLLAALTVLVSVQTAAYADQKPLTAGEMFQWCTADVDSAGDVFCTFYMSGFSNGAGASRGGSNSGEICLPPGFTGAETRAIFIRRMRQLPTLANKAVDAVVGAALSVQFPCKNSN